MGSSFSAPSPEKLKAVQDSVEQTIASHPIVIFAKTTCPHCVRAKQMLSKDFPDVGMEVVYLDMHMSGGMMQRYLQDKTGQRTVPNVFISTSHSS
ncbi:hypothetical protein BDV98DRAFT_568929 [Pterulicium gracile]|uniref:Glutaredoxin domain-containing protein n=1 Tax=Pterulicium gracile TaxID=1884261 RepID=A0A5C3QL50_9AGAR|nr:hypothetical protein BDV98DRAFT_568929 [Pterula gracilis]